MRHDAGRNSRWAWFAKVLKGLGAMHTGIWGLRA